MSIRLARRSNEHREPVTREALEAYFHQSAVPREQWRVGAEFERLALYRDTGLQVPYGDREGVRTILEDVAERFDWTPHYEDGHIVALARNGSVITFEPGAQVELATRPARSLRAIEEELLRHASELAAVVDPERLAWVCAGISPYSTALDIPLVPKARYRVMADYLPRRSSLAHEMMRCTASTQASFDYADEAGAGKRLFAALSLAPFVSAIFANSPVHGGKPTGMLSYRGRVWQGMDPDRSGLLCDLVRDETFSFARWVEFLLDLPMMFYCIDDRFIPAHGRPFRDFMAKGLEGYFPTIEDWEMHLTTLFTEVRLKSYIEVRGADATNPRLALGFVALWKGLFYDDTSLEQAIELAKKVPARCRKDFFSEQVARGLEGRCGNRTIRDWCTDIVDIAAQGLERQAAGRDAQEREYLARVLEVIEEGRSPARRLADAWPSIGSHPDRVIDLLGD